MKKKYNGIGEEITGEVENRGLTYTRNSFLSYRDTLLNKNFQNSTVLGQKPSYVKYAALSQLTYIKWNPYQAASE
ncbi:hypothetical protein [Leptospira noguchii]|uniref:Uncharacterized protein n=1 Tax=Leptospira noguchii TaxID=28182 RepID=A0AAE9KB98_9LEPT|nr:hypothetical protein [Leptospira noguchii]UOG58816.1 hypothetical protein MAL03_20495 [Leptospira noguchii]